MIDLTSHSVVTPVMDKAGLRRYGLLMAGLTGTIFGALGPLLRGSPIPRWPWAVALAFLAAATIKPAVLKPVHLFWMRLGLILGAINSRIILTVVYYVIVFPYGLTLRLFGNDPLARKKDAVAPSYRKVSTPPPNLKSSMERPF